MKTKKQNKKKTRVITAFFKLIPDTFRIAPWFFVVCNILSILHGFSFGVTTWVTQIFFDRATAYSEQRVLIGSVIMGLVFLGLANIICQILNGVANFIVGLYVDKSQGKLSKRIHEKMSRLSPVCFEDTEKLDDINKAEQGKNNSAWFVWSILSTFTFYIPYFSFMAVYLYNIKPLLALSLLVVFLPTMTTQILRAKVFSKLEDRAAPVRREFNYYESCLTAREYYKETRILGAFSFFKKLYIDSLVFLNKLTFRANVISTLSELGMKFLSLLGYFGILYMLFISLMNGEITIGAFAAVFASVGFMFSVMEELICRHFGNLAQNLGTIQNYIAFLKLPERKGEKITIPDDIDISVNNISFTYPAKNESDENGNAEEPLKKAVDNVSFTIKKGETIALVGENGSGKSTLVRLITGLYLPDEGNILYGSTNIKNISTISLFKRISAVFQKYQRYQMTMRENIGISDTENNPNDDLLDRICKNAGIDKNNDSFTDGYETMLSREFDGVDLSGGQWQRIAIARSFFRTHNFIILDEPTAAIDPLEETKVYNRFAEISKDKTSIIVTHRLGSVKLADRILVMKNGQLTEQGTHNDLINADGEYARLYKTQEQWYK